MFFGREKEQELIRDIPQRAKEGYMDKIRAMYESKKQEA